MPKGKMATLPIIGMSCTNCASNIEKNNIIVYIWYVVLPIVSYLASLLFQFETKIFFDGFVVTIPFFAFPLIFTKGRILNYKESCVLILYVVLLLLVWFVKQFNLWSFDFWSGVQYLFFFRFYYHL